MLEISELIIFNKSIKFNNINTKLNKNFKINKIEITAFYKRIKTININRDSLL